MRKIFKIALPVFLMVFMLVSVSNIAFAKGNKVNELSATVSGNTITINGKTEEAMVACAISVYDETGTKLVAMKTTSVLDDNTFSDSIAVESAGKYVVKVADYEGGDYMSTIATVLVGADGSPATVKVKSAKTYDDYSPYLWMGIICLGTVSMGAVLTYSKVKI